MIRFLNSLCAWTALAIAPAMALAQDAAVPDYDAREWYWQWGTMIGVAALILLVCFKNPKRSHDN